MRRPSIVTSSALVAALLFPCPGFATEYPKPDVAPDIYAKPARLIPIGEGRRLNLRCTGNGSPTVMLESGMGADSLAWFKVQPQVAQHHRVCSYDRAGDGFSDAGPMPRNIDAEVADLHALIQAAAIRTPLVLVGHSLGSNIVRRYADKHPDDVAGMVLVDPPPQHIAEFSPAWVKTDDEMRMQGLAVYRQCEKGAENGQLASPPPALQGCLRGPSPAYSTTLNAAIRAYHSRPAFWQTMISMTQTNGELFKQPVSPQEHHGAMPLIVLTADETFAGATPADRKVLEAARERTHELIAAASTRGERITVTHSTHDMQVDRPDAVIDAIDKVIRQTGPAAAK
ncbi:alpha/beta hydrolase [Rhodanobacter sp. C05]|uniref:alpha/beta fold hydrolase n=1 Tax=Rhodanobacter sp. C05 TaxID=1945855 RepID=UPI000984B730|nr:alpha/beta hydrolase [Rhodanobacter sp. C05]OOG40795.1 hypothetical protein B0E51_09230 [Rhodanobacter sp. C05]